MTTAFGPLESGDEESEDLYVLARVERRWDNHFARRGRL